MDVLRRLEAEGAEELQVERQARQPLVAAHHMGRAHEMVVDGVGEVVGRDAVGLEQDVVDVIFRDGQRALDQVGVLKLILDRAGGAEAQHPGLALRQRGLDVLNGTVAPEGELAVVAEVDLALHLLRHHGAL